MTQQQQFQKRIRELEEISFRNSQYLFTGFLNEAEYADVLSLGEPACGMRAWGGHEAAERVMVRFGDPESFGYEEPFPIRILKAAPLMEKYADALTHRDFLGALLHLGIERRVIGDILLDGVTAYIFCDAKMADFLTENLTRVKHTDIRCAETEQIPDALKPSLKEMEIQVTSERLDAVVSHVCGLSRSEAQNLFRRQEVFVNGRVMENLSRIPQEGDLISVRHMGKFRYAGQARTTRRGKLCLRVEKYV